MVPKGWRKSTVGRSCAIKNNLRFPINAAERQKQRGPYPYFGPTGQLDALDHYRTNEPIALIGEDGDHFLKFNDRPMTQFFDGKANVNNHAHVIGDSTDCLAKWFYFFFMHRDLTPVLSRQGVGRYKLTKAGLELLEIVLPPIEEQHEVIRALDTWDAAITATEKLLANSCRQKEILSHDLLTGRVRRAGFATSTKRIASRIGTLPQDWQQLPIRDIAAEISVKNHGAEALPVLSCTKHLGLVDSLSYFTKRVFSENTCTYKIVPRGAFAYATNHIDEGSIGYQNLYDRALISPMYTVFKPNDRIHHGFLYKLLKTEHYRQIFAASTNASVDRRGSLRWNDFRHIEIPCPSLAEQAAISAVIDQAQAEIDKLEQQVAALREEKRALMADLLTGKRRVKITETAANA